jgi:pimeloyl-ACP methyl ester carboxylesterase
MMTALVITIVVIVAAYLALGAFARAYLRPGKRRTTKTPESLDLDGEAFALPTDRGAIRGWFLRAAREPRITVVLAHGWQSHAGDMLTWAAPIVRSGFHVVVYDTLGHGESDPSEYTSIRHFLEDLRAVIAFAGRFQDTHPGIVIMGHSMGGAAALLASIDTPGVRGVIAAAAPTDPLEITREWIDARGLPGPLLVALMRPFWVPIVKASYPDLQPIRKIASIEIPVLLIHGDADKQVPVHHAHRLAAANPRARIEVLAGADHISLPKHERYAMVIADFLRSL